MLNELELPEGTVLEDRFTVLGTLGRGGFSRIYEVRDGEAIRALKILKPRLDPEHLAEARERFLREAGMCSRLDHPNIVEIFDYGYLGSDQDVAWMLLERVPGADLRTRIDKGPLPPDQVVILARAVASALIHAHQLGIVHRDIKPRNIMWSGVSPAGVRLLDFGVAKDLEAEFSITHPDSLIGSPGYMAPEQIKNSGVDARTDLYLLGLVLYECLIGRPPFDRTSSAITLIERVHEEVPPFYQRNDSIIIPPDLEEIVLRCLRNDPEERYASAADLLVDLEAVDLRSLEDATLADTGGVMTFRIQALVQSGMALLVGMALLLMPQPILGLFAIEAHIGTDLMARVAGGMLFALGATLWAIADEASLEARRKIVLGNLSCDASLALFFAVYALSGHVNTLGGGLAALFFINAVCWGLVLPGRDRGESS